ncbi:MAG: 50S ribosomal protein L17 [Candidatus Dependentiae bacterium]|jgi:large subunit ribosomal protein L17
MKHQSGYKKLNIRSAHRRALLRNQVIHLVKYGVLQTTKPRAKAVQRLAEKIVTIARKGADFNTIRRVNQLLPYDKDACKKLVTEVAPKYVDRPGGYTRTIPLGRRQSDGAPILRLQWVD